jgi:DNA-binding CsgD family transcriptional regulator
VAGRAEPGSDGWCANQCWLGWAAASAADRAGALGHFTAARDAAGDRGPSRVLVDALVGRSSMLLNTGHLAEGTEDGRRSLAMARELGYPAGEGAALRMLAIAAYYNGDYDGAVQLIRQMQVITGMPGQMARQGSLVMIMALIEAGDLAAAAVAVHARQQGAPIDANADETRRREEALSEARQALGPARFGAAEQRGAAMSLDTAAEYALMLTDTAPPPPAAGPGLGGLSARERELVTLVAQGCTNAQIAAQLYISVRTVGSHLDRIRDKTGCRRRADLTRLALATGLV